MLFKRMKSGFIQQLPTYSLLEKTSSNSLSEPISLNMLNTNALCLHCILALLSDPWRGKGGGLLSGYSPHLEALKTKYMS